jgi:hypothetical protein
MKLIYRGVIYNNNHIKLKALFPDRNKTKLVHELMYRGSTYQLDSTIVPIELINYELTYRGNTYQVNLRR